MLAAYTFIYINKSIVGINIQCKNALTYLTFVPKHSQSVFAMEFYRFCPSKSSRMLVEMCQIAVNRWTVVKLLGANLLYELITPGNPLSRIL